MFMTSSRPHADTRVDSGRHRQQQGRDLQEPHARSGGPRRATLRAGELAASLTAIKKSLWLQDVAQAKGAVFYTFEAARRKFTDNSWVPAALWKAAHCPSDELKPYAETPSASIVDTDDLNSDISLLALCLLKEKCPAAFDKLRVAGPAVQEGLSLRPPCRWEQHVYSVAVPNGAGVGGSVVSVQVVLDMGHNPAAVGALSRRIRRDLVGKNVR